MNALLALLAGVVSILLFLFLTDEYPHYSGPVILCMLLTYIVVVYVILWLRHAKQDD